MNKAEFVHRHLLGVMVRERIEPSGTEREIVYAGKIYDAVMQHASINPPKQEVKK